MTNNRLLIAVVTYQSAKVLPRLIDSLPAALEGMTDWRIVFADNASTDDSATVARTLAPYATVLDMDENLGYAAGINACMRLADPDEDLLILNADVWLERGAVKALSSACAEQEIGIVVPLVTRPDGTPEATLRRQPTPMTTLAEAVLGARAGRYGEKAIMATTSDPRGANADWANGAILFIPARVRTKIGLWREDLFLYSEEVDYCRRVTDAGWVIRQIPQARAVHQGGEVVSSPALWGQLITNKVVHMARWETRFAATLTWFFLLLAQLIRLPLRRGTHRRALVELLKGRKQLLAGIPTNPAASPAFQQRVLNAHGIKGGQ